VYIINISILHVEFRSVVLFKKSWQTNLKELPTTAEEILSQHWLYKIYLEVANIAFPQQMN